MKLASFVALGASLPTLAVSQSSVKTPLTMFDPAEYPFAKCLDGSPAGYYAQQTASVEDKNKWVLYLNGGGECDNEESCLSQTGSALGSSKYFYNESDTSSWYLASDYCPYNPTLCTWNHVMDPYCSQDLHSGQRTAASEDTFGLYFSGHHILVSTLDEMDLPPYNLKDATDIVVSGVSAGGIGVWMNLDYIANRYPDARVTGVTIAGMYFYATYYDGQNHTDPGGMADFRESAWPQTYELYDAVVDADCKEAQEAKGLSAGDCMILNVSFPFIQSDSFVVQAQTDAVVLTGHDNWPSDYMYEAPEQSFMAEWHANMTVALGPLMIPEEDKSKSKSQSQREGGGEDKAPRSGVFAAACYTHGGFTHSYPLLDGVNFYEAFDRFYSDVSPSSSYKLSDDCGEMCNPTCGA